MIWPFKKRKSAFTPAEAIPGGLVDVHSHILWGLDDGPAEAKGSDAMCRAYREMGYTTVIATPHHNHALFDSPKHDAVAARAQEVITNNPEGPKILPSGEIMFDDAVWDRIAAGELPSLGPSNTFLVEFSPHPGGLPMGLEDVVFRLQLRETALVIAHCERYSDLAGDPAQLKRLRTAGAIIQINIMSLSGRYGRTHMRTAWSLLEQGLADVLATDLHNPADATWVFDGLEEVFHWKPAMLTRLASVNPGFIAAGDPWGIVRDE